MRNFILKKMLITIVLLYGNFGVVQNSFAQEFSHPLIFDMYVSPGCGQTTYPFRDRCLLTTAPYGFHALHKEITPVTYPEYLLAPDDPRITGLYSICVEQNRPIGVYLDPSTAPLSGDTGKTDAIDNMMDVLSANSFPMNFVFADYEPAGDSMSDANMLEVINRVRGYSDSQISQAYIGNFNYSPGAYNGTGDFYLSSGLNVAMPMMYAFSQYATGTYGGSAYGDPNDRAALFSTPLELVSRGARGLPEGHLLIPYVSGFQDRSNGAVAAPPHEDTEAMLQHIRLRGADGYIVWRNKDDPTWFDPALPDDEVGNENFKTHMINAWTELDWLFKGMEKNDIEVMNLDTRTSSGFEWSAVETTNGGAVLLSNLNTSSQYFTFSELAAAGMSQGCLAELAGGNTGVSIAPGDHLLLTTGEPEPSVHYTFKETSPGTWEILVEVTGETAGLSAYEIWVDGVDSSSVSFAENTLWTMVDDGYGTVGFLPNTLIDGEVDGSFNVGNYQQCGDGAIVGIGMEAIYEEGYDPGNTPLIDLDVQALLGILTTEAGLAEENFRAMVVGLLDETGDGFYDADDIIPTLDVIPFEALLGDANGDGVVSAGDYACVQANFGNTGLTGGVLLGDANGDGVVSAGDYACVQANFGNTASSTVPEPTALILLILGLSRISRPKKTIKL